MKRFRIVLSDERGLLGKILALWLVLGLLLVVLAYDGVQVALTRFRVSDAAQSAAFDAATTLRTNRGDRKLAYEEALTEVEEAGGRLTEFIIDPVSGEVTVSVSDKASTLLLGRFGLFKSLTKATATDTSLGARP